MPNTNMTESEYRSLVSAIASATKELEKFNSKNKTVKSGLESLQKDLKGTAGYLDGAKGKVEGFSSSSGKAVLDLGKLSSGLKDVSGGAAALGQKMKEAGGNSTGAFSAMGSALDSIGNVTGVMSSVSSLAGGIATLAGGAGSAALPLTLAAGAVAGLGTVIHNVWERMVREDLEGRFGSIALSADEIAAAVGRIATNPSVKRAEDTLNRVADTESKFDELQITLNDIASKSYSIKFGIVMKPQDIEEVRSDIDSFIKQGEDILREKRLTVSLEMGGLGEDETAAKVVSAFSGLEKAFEEKGAKLREVFNNAIADGKLSDEEWKTIFNLQNEMTDMLEIVTQSRYEMELKNLSIRGELTAESYTEFLSQVNAKTDEAFITFNESAQQRILDVDVAYRIGKLTKEERDKMVKAIEDDLAKEKMFLTLPTLEITVGQVKAAFSSEMAQGFQAFQTDFKSFMASQVPDLNEFMYNSQLVGTYFDSMISAFKDKVEGFDDQVVDNAKKLFASMQGQREQLEALVQQYREMGQSVPREIMDALSDIHMLGAIGKNEESIWYLIGQKYANDPAFEELVQAARLQGTEINDHLAMGIYASSYLLSDAEAAAILQLRDSCIENVENMSPEMQGMLSQLGFDTSVSFTDNFSNGVLDNIQLVKDSATGAVTAFKSAITGETIAVTPELLTLMSSLGLDMNSEMASSLAETNLLPPEVLSPDHTKPLNQFVSAGRRFFDNNPFYVKVYADSVLNLAIAKNVPMANAMHDYNINISRRAVGGVFHSPQIIEVGEAGPEAVVPLKDNAPWIAGLAQSVSARIRLDAFNSLFRQMEAQAYMANRKRTETGTDYDLLASKLAEELRRSPITVSADLKNNVDVKVNMDGEAVGRATAPTISRILARRGG